MNRLRVINRGEPTEYYVESNSLECLEQAAKISRGESNKPHLFSRRLKPSLMVGGPCPRCGGQLDLRFHKVDIAAWNGNGECACEFFQMSPTMRAKVSRMHPNDQAQGLCRCSHIEAARNFALDVALKAQAARELPRRAA